MTLEVLRRKILKRKEGKFRLLKVGEFPKEGDIQFGYDWVGGVDESQAEKPVKAGEVIIRLEINK